ncbi:MAG TPA: hypothetical protein VKZ60_08360 [Chloroflexota bacterium]|nr:hypothetical protein [Chloroflexota bacterium]
MQPSLPHPTAMPAHGSREPYPWEAELVASLERLIALQRHLEAQVARLHGLEHELARLRPVRDIA